MMISETTNNFPWDDLETPWRQGEFVTQFISEGVNPRKHRVFWARSWRNKPALFLEYDATTWVHMDLPSFKNITVRDVQERGALTVELFETSMEAQELFLKVCNDIVESLQKYPAEESRRVCIYRLQRWSAFLRPGRRKLSAEQQKGLIAELNFLQRDVLASQGPDAALDGWAGPDGGKRDFAYGQVLAEVKSKRDSAHHEIAISSEDQLSMSPSERLFLCVTELNSASGCHEGTFTLDDAVERVRGEFDSPFQREVFEGKLASAGYFEEDDYSDSRWSEGSVSYYEVRDGFPCLCSEDLRPGVSRVNYYVDLNFCGDFLVDRETIVETMG